MRTDSEQRVRNDIQRRFPVEAEEPQQADSHPEPRRHPPGLAEMAIGGLFIAVMLFLVGAVAAGLTVAVATALGWLIWRFLPRSTGHDDPDAAPREWDLHTAAGRHSRHPRTLGP